MLDRLADIPEEKRRMLGTVVDAFQKVPDIAALVLGGSCARGLARPDSDVDIGIYYREASPFAIDQVHSVAEGICTPGTVPVVTGLYGWGAWVNGGAWIQTPVGRVDFLYRNLDQVERVIEEGQRGIWRHDYDQQPPYGFRSVVYFAETFFCVPLHDPKGAVARLKEAVLQYPKALKEQITQDSLWNAEFSLRMCRAFAKSADVYNCAGCLTRVANLLVHVLFALNEEYFLSDKYTVELLRRFAVQPSAFADRVAAVLSNLGADSAALQSSLDAMGNLWVEVVELAGGAYRPRFDLPIGSTEA